MKKYQRKLFAWFMTLIMISQQVIAVSAVSAIAADEHEHVSAVSSAAVGSKRLDPIAAYDFLGGKLSDNSPRHLADLTIVNIPDDSDEAWIKQQRSAGAAATNDGIDLWNGWVRLPDNLFSDLNVADITGMTVSVTFTKHGGWWGNDWSEHVFSFSERWMPDVPANISDRARAAFYCSVNGNVGTGQHYYGNDGDEGGNWIDGSIKIKLSNESGYGNNHDNDYDYGNWEARGIDVETLHNLTVTYDVATNRVIQYIDGKVVASSERGNYQVKAKLSAADIKSMVANSIGIPCNGGWGMWGFMRVQDFTAYSSALSPKQVEMLYNEGWEAVAEDSVADKYVPDFNQKGEFTAVAMNVDGLPKKILTFTINADGKEGPGATAIGNGLKSKGYDIIGVSEDFNFDSELTTAIGSGYSKGTHGGKVTSTSNSTDGLNLFWKKSAVSVTGETRVAWTKNYSTGTFGQNNGGDKMIKKGYRYYKAEVASGMYVDIYILHMDAETDAGDNEARESQIIQLVNAIKASNNKNPIIVMGDTNCRYTRDRLEEKFVDAINADSRFTVKDCWVETSWGGVYPLWQGIDMAVKGSDETYGYNYEQAEVVDKIYFINNTESHTTLRLNGFETDTSFVNSNGEPLADHWPIVATFGYTDDHIDEDGDGYCNKVGCGACVHKVGADGHCTEPDCVHNSATCACGGRQHVDANNDGYCDKKCHVCMHTTGSDGHCSNASCTHDSATCACGGRQHVDSDGDGWCDKEGCQSGTHKAGADGHCTDPTCTHEPGAQGCTCGGRRHVDDDGDGYCDIALCHVCMHVVGASGHCANTKCKHGATCACGGATHADANGDGYCDVASCNVCMHSAGTNGHCTDANCTHGSTCTCGGKTHADANGDGYCDITKCKACMHSAGADGHCTDVNCTHKATCACGGKTHADANGDGYCDIALCHVCMHSAGADGHCTSVTCKHEADCACGGAAHSDKNGDGYCDIALCHVCMHKAGVRGHCTSDTCNHGADCACGGLSHSDTDNDGYCDIAKCKACMHSAGANGHCTDSSCVHDPADCECGGRTHSDEDENGYCDIEKCGECMHSAGADGHCTSAHCDHGADCVCGGSGHPDEDNDGYCDKNTCGICIHKQGSDGYCTSAHCDHDSSCTCGGAKHVHTDDDGDGYCDGSDCGICMHRGGSNGHCTDAGCDHGADCTCGGLNHVDEDNDGYCDKACHICMHSAGADGHCTDADCNHRASCACGGTKHVDANNDGYCDKTCHICMHSAGTDGHCTDADCDHGATCACGGLGHADEDGDGYCDIEKCGECMHSAGADGHCTNLNCDHGATCACGGKAHADADGDGYCDISRCHICMHTAGDDGHCTDTGCNHASNCACGGLTHPDEDGDGWCDKENCHLGLHKAGSDGHCTHPDCDHDPAAPECKCGGRRHIDEDGDGYCDIALCHVCVHEAGDDSHCTDADCDHDSDCACGGLTHPDEDGDGWCDKENCHLGLHKAGDDGHCTHPDCDHDPAASECKCGGRRHIDTDNDGYCDITKCDVCVHEAGADGHCTDADCNHDSDCACGGKRHIDAVKDGYCDICRACMHKIGLNDHCTNVECKHKADCECGGLTHPDEDGDGYCDKEHCHFGKHVMGADGHCTEPDCDHDPSDPDCTCGGSRHVDEDGDGYCDLTKCRVCMHEAGDDSYCTDADCDHDSDCTCGGKKPTVITEPKLPTIEISEDRTSVEANGTVIYTVKSNVPNNLKEYLIVYLSPGNTSEFAAKPAFARALSAGTKRSDSYMLAFCGEMDKSLILDENSVAVSIGDKTLTVEPQVAVSEEKTVLRVELDLIALYKAGTVTDDDIADAAPITMTYSVKAAEDIEPGAHANKVYVEYEEGRTAEEVIEVKSYAITILNRNPDDNKPIAGSLFALVDENGTEIARKESDKDGYVTFKGLAEGKYSIKEISVSGEYDENSAVIPVEISDSEKIASGIVSVEFNNVTAPNEPVTPDNPNDPGNVPGEPGTDEPTPDDPGNVPTGVADNAMLYTLFGMAGILAYVLVERRREEEER